MDRMGIAWVFDTKDLLLELFWIKDQLREAEFNGYTPVVINQDDFFSMKNEGRTKIVIILERKNGVQTTSTI